MVDLTEWVRTRAQRVKNPSRRTPDRETTFNDADNIEKQLQEDGYKIWGWVIYRCTYESDKEWEAFMTRLRSTIHNTLEINNALDVLENLDYRVFEDKALFDKASPAGIREHFEEWTTTALHHEQGPEAVYSRDSQRYNYCLHIDQAALVSVLSAPDPLEDYLSNGFVNLVCLHIRGGMRVEHTEGRDERDCCWMRISYLDLMSTWYNFFRAQGSWFAGYRVPPEVSRP